MREDKRLKNLIKDLRAHHVNELDQVSQYRLVQDTADIIMLSSDFFYFSLFCEIMYLIHLLLEFWFTDLFLGGSFVALGFEWLRYNHHIENPMYDPLVRVFPRLAKCNFHKYGFSGSVETYDVLCFMSLNIVNEKFYVLIWFWYLFLLLVTIIYIFLYRFPLMLLPSLRYRYLKSIAPTANPKFLRKLTSSVSNWFVLQIIAHNIKPYYFRDLLDLVLEYHFDDNYKPHKRKKTSFPFNGQIPSAPPGPDPVSVSVPKTPTSIGTSSTEKKRIKNSNKKQASLSQNNPAPEAGFVLNTTDQVASESHEQGNSDTVLEIKECEPLTLESWEESKPK